MRVNASMAEPMALMSEQQVALLYRVQADIEQVLQLQRQQLSAAALAAELETESAAAMLAAAVPPGAPRGAAVAPAEMPSGPDEDCESPEDFASAAASSDTAAAQAAEQDLLARQLAWSCDLAWPETFGLRLRFPIWPALISRVLTIPVVLLIPQRGRRLAPGAGRGIAGGASEGPGLGHFAAGRRPRP